MNNAMDVVLLGVYAYEPIRLDVLIRKTTKLLRDPIDEVQLLEGYYQAAISGYIKPRCEGEDIYIQLSKEGRRYVEDGKSKAKKISNVVLNYLDGVTDRIADGNPIQKLTWEISLLNGSILLASSYGQELSTAIVDRLAELIEGKKSIYNFPLRGIGND